MPKHIAKTTAATKKRRSKARNSNFLQKLSAKGFLQAKKLPNRVTALILMIAFVAVGIFVISRSQAATTPTLGLAVDSSLVSLARDNPAALDDYFTKASATGAKWIRFQYEFNQIEPEKGQFNWSRWDALTTKANAHGLKVTGILLGSPSWAVPSTCNPYYWLCAPNAADFGSFAGAIASHYDGQHSAGKVDAWEIWNEPNCGEFIPRNPATYTSIVKAAYGPIKSASGATVLAGGSMICKTDTAASDYNPRDWLTAMYKNGAHGYFDALTHHPYCWVGRSLATSQICPLQEEAWSGWSMMYKDFPDNNEFSTDGRSLRTILAANGDANLPIWMTEFGAPTSGDAYLNQADQNRQLLDSYNWLKAQSPGLYGPMFWYEFQDRCSLDGLSGDSCGSTEAYFGLVDYNGNPKTAYNTFKTLNTSATPTPTPTPTSTPTPSSTPSSTVTVTNLTPSGTFRPGATTTVNFTLNTTALKTVDGLIVVARDANGANYDFPSQPTPLNLTGAQTFKASRTLPAGAYQYWVAYHSDGAWTDLLPKQNLSISAAGTGLSATYYNNQDFTGKTATRRDAAIDFNWGTDAPISGIAADTFSTRWTGRLMAPATGSYTFSINSDDGMAVWINGTKVVEDWTKHSLRMRSSQPITLQAGQMYSVRVEYYEATSAAVAQLLWTGPGIGQGIIPQMYLYP